MKLGTAHILEKYVIAFRTPFSKHLILRKFSPYSTSHLLVDIVPNDKKESRERK